MPPGPCYPHPSSSSPHLNGCSIPRRVLLDSFNTIFPLALIPSPSPFPTSMPVTDCQASGAAHLLCSCRLASSDWHAQCVFWIDLPACVALLLKFLCQIPNEESVAGSAWLAGLPPPACLMKRMPVGFIIKNLQITDRERSDGGVELSEMAKLEGTDWGDGMVLGNC